MSNTAEPRCDVELFLDEFARRREETALVYGERRITYGELVDQTYRMTRALSEYGLQPGQTVTLLGANAPEMMIARYAANLLGCTVAHLYNGMSTQAKAAIVSDVDTRALLYDPQFAADAEQVLQQHTPEFVLALGAGGPGTDLLALATQHPADPVASRARPDDVQHVRHTGGTTGHPKGICRTFGGNLRSAGSVADAASPFGFTRQLAATTIAHAAGGLADATLHRGGTVVLHDEFDAGAVLRTIEQESITDMWLLPPLLYELLDHPDFGARDLSSLRCIVYGGCAASPTRLAQGAKSLDGVLHQIYGQTEAGLITVLPPEEHDPDRPELLATTGRLVPTTELAVCDEHGDEVAAGERGELWVRNERRMHGYWKQPELTARTIVNGWVHTGDVGYLDEDGYLHLVDRVKDMIVVVGGHVYTSEVEEVLFTHPQVRVAAVFGVPDPDGAEVVHAAVVPEPGAEVDPSELAALVERRKGSMYRPRHVHVLDRLPLTHVGKPDKKALRAQLVPAEVAA